MKFIKPVDRFNFVLSGALKKLINFTVGIDLLSRNDEIGIELGPRRDGMCLLEIR